MRSARAAARPRHWLPLLYEQLDTLFDYVGDAPFVLDQPADDAAASDRADAR